MSSDVSGLTEKALYLATMRADQKSGQQLHKWATPFLYFMFRMGLNQNPVVGNAEPHGAEVILISDMQVYTNGFVLHDLGSDQPQS